MRRADGARKIFKIWPTRMAKKIPFWCNYQNYYRYNNVDLGKEVEIRRLLEHLHIVASELIEITLDKHQEFLWKSWLLNLIDFYKKKKMKNF